MFSFRKSSITITSWPCLHLHPQRKRGNLIGWCIAQFILTLLLGIFLPVKRKRLVHFPWCTIRSGAGFMDQKRWTVIWRKLSSESVSKPIGCAWKPCQQIELLSVMKLTFWSLALQSCLYLICFIIIKIEVLPNIKILSFSENRSS